MGSLMSNNDAPRIDAVLNGESDRALTGRVAHLPQVTQTSPLREFVEVLWKGRWVVLSVFTVSVFASVLYVFLKTPIYRGTATIEIDPNRTSSLGLGDLVAEKLSGKDSARLLTEVQILESNTVALHAISILDEKYHKKLTKDADIPLRDVSKLTPAQRDHFIGQIQSELKVAALPNTNLIEISYTARDAVYAADVVNAVLDAYVEHDFRSRYESANQVSEWLSKQMEDIKTRAEDAQQKLADFQQKNNIIGDEKDNIVTEKLRTINDQLTMAEADRIVKEARVKVAETGNPDLLASVVPTTTLNLLRTQQAQLQSDSAAMAAKFGPNYPKLKETKEQLAKVQVSIDAENRNVQTRIEDDFQASKRTEDMLRGEFEKQKSKAFELNQGASQFAILKHEVESTQDLYDTLQLKLKEAGVTAGLNSDVSVIDRAEVPMKPTAPRPVFSILLGMLLGVLGGVAGAFALESFDDTVNGTDETEALSRLPVLTAIPEFRYIKALRKLAMNGSSNGHGANYVETLISPKSLVAEGYRTLHNSIVFSSVDKPPRVLVFTSALPQEGKSTTCLNYATVLAQKGAKVLLVDADLRRPSLARRLAVTSSEGLGSLLLHQATTDLVFRPIEELPTLFFMPAGPVPTAPADALSSNRMKEILKLWSANYDHVIIDTPPILSVSDSLALAREADGVIMVIRAGRTPKRALLRSRDLLVRMQARIFGVVLNAVNVGVNGSYYNYSNSYGYGYSDGEDN